MIICQVTTLFRMLNNRKLSFQVQASPNTTWLYHIFQNSINESIKYKIGKMKSVIKDFLPFHLIHSTRDHFQILLQILCKFKQTDSPQFPLKSENQRSA